MAVKTVLKIYLVHLVGGLDRIGSSGNTRQNKRGVMPAISMYHVPTLLLIGVAWFVMLLVF